jgi:hypothetical protein
MLTLARLRIDFGQKNLRQKKIDHRQKVEAAQGIRAVRGSFADRSG